MPSILRDKAEHSAPVQRAARLILAGFTQNKGIRVFVFEHVTGGARNTFEVSTELAVALRYGIRLQELPLLCRQYLEHRIAEQQTRDIPEHPLIFSEAEMVMYAKDCRAAELQKHPRRAPVWMSGKG